MHDSPAHPGRSVDVTPGVHTRPAETRLTERALERLSTGPASPVELIEYVCQMPGAPKVVAEQMALALFSGRAEFVRDGAGAWSLRGKPDPSMATASSMADALGTLSYAVVDVETTGSSPWFGDRITEVAAIVVRDGAVVRRFETLVNPERSIPPIVTALTRINWEMVKDAPKFGDVCRELLAVLEGSVFVAHNAAFDWRFLTTEVERATGRRMHGRRLCTVKMARCLLPQLWSRRLDAVAYHYGIEIPMRHRAGGDAIATAQVLIRLLEEARNRECVCWDDLQRLLRAQRRKRRRRRPPAMPQPASSDATA